MNAVVSFDPTFGLREMSRNDAYSQDLAHHRKEVMLFIWIEMIHIASVRIESSGNTVLLEPTPRAPAGGYDGFFAFKMKPGNIRGIVNDVHQTRSFLSEPDIERTVDLE